MIDRPAVVQAVAAELDARAGRCLEAHGEVGAAVADRLGLVHRDMKPAKPSSWLFVRRQSWVSPELAARIGGAILCTRSGRGRVSVDREWCAEARARGVALAGWDWMLPPGEWRRGLVAEAERLLKIGAVAWVLNIEPASGSARGTSEDWRGRKSELAAYVGSVRELCDEHGLELWVSSWALPTAAPTFPWRELLEPADVAIPQPYEVHGRKGAAYVERSIAEYRERGARGIIVGRGAHELEDDGDAWRTPAQIRRHRESTPAGLREAWWCPAGRLRAPIVDAMVG